MKSLLLKRGIAFVIDVYVITLIVFGAVWFVTGDIALLAHNLWIAFVPAYILLLLKDIFRSSLGKLLMKIEVVDFHDRDSKIPLWKLFLRNVATPIWIVDVILLLSVGKKQKLMDSVLALDVIYFGKNGISL